MSQRDLSHRWCLDGAPVLHVVGGRGERRERVRWDLSRAPCEALLERHDGCTFSAAVTNVSDSGIWVEVSRPFAMSQGVSVSVRSPSGELCSYIGHVVRRSAEGMALMLHDSDGWLDEVGLREPPVERGPFFTLRER